MKSVLNSCAKTARPTMRSTEEWSLPHGGDPEPCQFFDTAVSSWALKETIWTPHWRDAFPPTPCLCSAWGGLSDESRMRVWANI